MLLVLFSAGLIAVSVVCFMLTDTDLLPEMDEGGFVLDYWTPAGSSLTETNRIISHLEQMLSEVPEIESTSRRTGLRTRPGRSDGSQSRRHPRQVKA